MSKWQDFIDLYDSYNTKKQYRAAIKTFFKTIYKSEFKDLEQTTERYFGEERDYKKDATEFFKIIRNRPPQVVRSRISTVKVFLEFNEIDLPQKFWKMLRRKIKGSSAVSEEIIPNNEELRKILSHMRIKGKAFFLVLASSGMRLGEALGIEFDDVHLEEEPTRIWLRREITKTGNPRTVFISEEATEALREWLKIRDDWIKEAIVKSVFKKKVDNDNRIFPFTNVNANIVWNRALDKARLNSVDKTTNRRKMHIHTLRKFFRTKMGEAIPKDIAEELIGHDVYRKHSSEQLADFYRQGELNISIFGTSTAELTELKEKVDKKSELMTYLLEENKKLSIRMAKMEKALDWMLSEIRSFQIQILKRQGDTPEQIEEMMKAVGSRKEDYMKDC